MWRRSSRMGGSLSEIMKSSKVENVKINWCGGKLVIVRRTNLLPSLPLVTLDFYKLMSAKATNKTYRSQGTLRALHAIIWHGIKAQALLSACTSVVTVSTSIWTHNACSSCAWVGPLRITPGRLLHYPWHRRSFIDSVMTRSSIQALRRRKHVRDRCPYRTATIITRAGAPGPCAIV